MQVFDFQISTRCCKAAINRIGKYDSFNSS
jgi:hypothetical protein